MSQKDSIQVNVQGSQYTIIGDHTSIYNYAYDPGNKDKAVLQALSKLHVLPGKPFHMCFIRNEKINEVKSIFNEIKLASEEDCLTAVFITGPPGSGKTQLARQFGEDFLKDPESEAEFPPIIITLNVYSVESLLRSLKELLEDIGLSENVPTEDNVKQLLKLQLDELRKILNQYPGKWLLVFDNMFRNSDVSSALPKPGCENWGQGKCIITTQDSDVVPAGHVNAGVCSLKNGMQPADAHTLLAKISHLAVDEFAEKLAKDVEYFPLSLACCATYVRQMNVDLHKANYSWEKFYEVYRTSKSLTFRTYIAHNVYPFSMVVAARMAAVRLAEGSVVLRHAFNYLSYCALAPVPLCIISNFVHLLLTHDLPHDEIQHEDEIKAEIFRCSLLSTSCYLSVECTTFHQVMADAFEYAREQPLIKAKLSEEERERLYTHMLTSLNASFKDSVSKYDTFSVALKVLASHHLKTFLSYGDSKTWNRSPEFVVVLANVADALYHLPGSTQTERVAYVERAYTLAKKLPQPMTTGIAYCKVLKTLGFFYRETDRLDESVVVLSEAVELTRGQSDGSWLDLKSSILSVLGWTYKLQDKLDFAEEAMKQSIRVAKDVFGEKDERIVERLCNLAIIYREKYDMRKARETADEARRLAKISTNEWHLNRAQAANYSAKIYLRSAEIEENVEAKHVFLSRSLEMHAEALRIYDKVLGKDHIYVAGVCTTYAMVNKELRAFPLAMEQIKRAEKIYTDVHHIQLRSALRYKTEVLLAIGDRSQEAEETIQRSIEKSDCGRARFLLAQVYVQQKKFREALVIFNEVLTRWKSGVLPKTHFWIKQAQEFKWTCQCEIFKMYVPNKMYVCAILLLIFALFATVLFK